MIVGLGSIGRRHLQNLRQLRPDARIAVWRHRSQVSAEQHDDAIAYCASLDEVRTFGPSAAIISGPASTHLQIGRTLAEMGIHLFIEKPISENLNGVDALIDICRSQGLVLMTGYNLRFLPTLRTLKKSLEDRLIGEVLSVHAEVGQYLPDWRPSRDYRQTVSAARDLGGGVLLELSHELDYLNWFFGLPTRLVACGGQVSDLELDVEDLVDLVLEYPESPRFVSVHLDMIQRAPRRSCRLIGSDGTLFWDGIEDRLMLFRASTGAWEQLNHPQPAERNQMYIDELLHFLECITTGTAPIVDGEDGLRALAVVDAARRSLRSGTLVEVGSGLI